MNSPQPPIEEIHLTDYINVIMRRRRIFLISFCAIFVGVALYTFLMKPIYEASATMYIKDDKGGKSGVLGDLAMLSSSNNPVDSEIEILKSRSNAEEVVKRQHLTWDISNKSSGLNFKISEFVSTVEEPEYTIQVTGPDSFSVKPEDGSQILQCRSGQLLKTPTLSLLLSDLKGQPGDSFSLKLLPFNATVIELQKNIDASEVGKKTNIIKASYTNTSAVLARDVVNTLVQAYLEQSISFKTEEASRTVKFVEAQLKGTRDELDQSEKNLQSYKSVSGVVKLDTEADELIKKLSAIETDRAAVVLQRKQVEFALAALQEARRKGRVYTPAVLSKDDLLIGSLATRLTELEVQKRALVSENTERHPLVKAVQVQIDQLQKEIQSTYETSRLNLVKQETTIQQQLQLYEAKMRTLPLAERDLARLMRLSKVNADIYTFLLQKHEESRIAMASTLSNFNVVDPAIAPDLPLKPKKLKYLLFGLLVGLMFGVGAAFFTDYLDDTIKDPEQAKRAIGLPLLATIPRIPKREGQFLPGAEATVCHDEPKSVVSEAFRSLRTNLHFSAINRQKRVMLLTSAFPGEGKSTVTTNLAIIIAQTGSRTIIIDCDMRRSTLHENLGIAKVPGLSEVLAGYVALADAIHETSVPGLSLLAAGTTPPNPSELLGSKAMASLLTELRASYEHVIIEAPPVLSVTDAPVLTAMSDLVLVVMQAGRVPLKAAKRMREMLDAVQAPVAGLVMNDKTGIGGSYGYGYGYGYSYGADDQKENPAKKTWWRKLLK